MQSALLERTAALRNLKLLVGSGGIDFTKGMDSWDKHVEQISFRHWVLLKGRRPHFQLTVAKNSISTMVHWLQQSHVKTQSAINITVLHVTNLGDNNSVTKPSASLNGTGCFFSSAATKGWAWCKHNAELMESAAARRNLLLVGSGCLEIPKGMARIGSLDKHVEQICFWYWVKLKGQSRQLFIGAQQSHVTTESTSISCNPNLWQNQSLYCT